MVPFRFDNPSTRPSRRPSYLVRVAACVRSLGRGDGAGRGLVAFVFAAVLAACTPKIGDDCKLSTDCSLSGSSNRLCDTSQPGGYCTEFNCTGNRCGEDAACALFAAAVPGCGYDDRNGSSGARTARAFCVATCESDGDCRDGYACVDPRTSPWDALVLDDKQDVKTCMVLPSSSADAGTTDAGSPASDAVCQPIGPDVPPIDVTSPGTSDDAGPLPPLFPDGGLDAGDGG